MNMPGLNQAERTHGLELLYRMLVKAYGSRYHSVRGLCSGSRVCGLPKTLINALLSNVDARLHLLARNPGMELNEYATDTDDVELSFSALRMRAGYKAPCMQQLRLGRSIRRLRMLRLDPNSGVSLQHSKHRRYGAERCVPCLCTLS
jgi:hypothetical protein